MIASSDGKHRAILPIAPPTCLQTHLEIVGRYFACLATSDDCRLHYEHAVPATVVKILKALWRAQMELCTNSKHNSKGGKK
eukprot:SAG11_NODE_1431_length_4937_cov_1.954940_1_plen_80_part_10